MNNYTDERNASVIFVENTKLLFNSIQFIFAMSGMEAAIMTIRSSKFNATVKNSKRKSNLTSALTYLHFDQLCV